jgi:hypothetical protein
MPERMVHNAVNQDPPPLSNIPNPLPAKGQGVRPGHLGARRRYGAGSKSPLCPPPLHKARKQEETSKRKGRWCSRPCLRRNQVAEISTFVLHNYALPNH